MTTTRPHAARVGTTVALAEVCHICHTQRIPPSDAASWTLACTPCRRLDRRIVADHGLAQCTPLWGGVHGTARPSLQGTLLRGLPFRAATDALRAHHLEWVTAMAAAEGSGLVTLAGDDLSRSRIVDWETWQAAYPATPEAIVAGYQAYVRGVHPWIDSVEPRVADSRWLTGLLAV